MYRAQKKHLKELKRKKKLSARIHPEDDFPWRLNINCNQIRRNQMAEFQKTAYDNFNIKKALRDLHKEGKLKGLKRLETKEDATTLGDLIFAQLYKQKAIVAPYLIPRVVYGYDPYTNTLDVNVRIITPFMFQDKEMGNLYHFNFEAIYENKKYPVLFTTHALDRITQRCNMKANELDLSFWYWMLHPYWQRGYKFEKIDGIVYFIRTYEQLDKKVSFYFPIRVNEDCIVLKTTLSPGLSPCPTVENFDQVLLEIKKQFYKDSLEDEEDRKERVNKLQNESSINTDFDDFYKKDEPILKGMNASIFLTNALL